MWRVWSVRPYRQKVFLRRTIVRLLLSVLIGPWGMFASPTGKCLGPQAWLRPMLDIEVPGLLGGLQHALVYSLKEYMTARATWRKGGPGKGAG